MTPHTNAWNYPCGNLMLRPGRCLEVVLIGAWENTAITLLSLPV